MGELTMDANTYEPTPFGKEMKKHFLIDPLYNNINHGTHSPRFEYYSLIFTTGSFGTFPRAVRDKQREYQDLCESRPDLFIRYIYPKLLDESRAAVAQLLNAPVETIVYVSNATIGVNTVLRNLVWHKDRKDEILVFSTVYGACGKTVDYVCEASGDLVAGRPIHLTYPCEDADLISLFKKAIKTSRAERKFPRVALFDTISSMPGLRMPFEELTAICREEGILSLIDGAHAVGQIPVNLSTLDPDFFVSNCHKWLHVPRGCAVLYVPIRNQKSMRSTLPTSHGFEPRGSSIGSPSTMPSGNKSPYIQSFEFIGTIDNSNYLVIPEALKWREQVCGGEQSIMEYNNKLATDGSMAIAKILGTEVIDNKSHTLTNCCLVNVVLPLTASAEKIPGINTVNPQFGWEATEWMTKVLVDDYNTFIAITYFQDQWWARLSGQVYLDLDDFVLAGKALKEVCEKVAAFEEFS
jgi:selenocysteine lyase/cysteine desulfurase